MKVTNRYSFISNVQIFRGDLCFVFSFCLFFFSLRAFIKCVTSPIGTLFGSCVALIETKLFSIILDTWCESVFSFQFSHLFACVHKSPLLTVACLACHSRSRILYNLRKKSASYTCKNRIIDFSGYCAVISACRHRDEQLQCIVIFMQIIGQAAN